MHSSDRSLDTHGSRSRDSNSKAYSNSAVSGGGQWPPSDGITAARSPVVGRVEQSGNNDVLHLEYGSFSWVAHPRWVLVGEARERRGYLHVGTPPKCIRLLLNSTWFTAYLRGFAQHHRSAGTLRTSVVQPQYV